MEDAGIPALLQLEVEVGLLSQRGNRCVYVWMLKRTTSGKKKEVVGWAEADGATAGQEILFTYS